MAKKNLILGKYTSTFIASFILAGMLIGFFIVFQFNSNVTSNSFLVDELQAQNQLIQNYHQDAESMQRKISLLRKKIEENQSQFVTETEKSDLNTLKKYKEVNGLTEVTGEGLEITLDDGSGNTDKNSSFIYASDLRDMINLVRTAQVKAISINDKRVLPSTTINAVGNAITIDGARYYSPFKIKAIGNTEMLVNRLSDQNAYQDLYKRIQSEKVIFDVRNIANLKITAATGDSSVKFLKKSE